MFKKYGHYKNRLDNKNNGWTKVFWQDCKRADNKKPSKVMIVTNKLVYIQPDTQMIIHIIPEKTNAI